MKIRRKFKRSHIRDGKTDADDMRIYVSPIMFVMALYFVATGMTYEFFCSLAAVLLHECAHARVAKKLGYELNVIRLMPYGAALCGDADINVKHEIPIAVAGPILNVVLATVFAAMWWLVPSSYMFTESFCKCNLYIGLFNLLPVYPLDGGRVALALLSMKLKRAKAYKLMRILSAVFGILAIVLFALSAMYSVNLCLLSIGIFMLVSSFVPDRRAQYSALFSMGKRRERLDVSPLEVRTFAVSENSELSALCGVLDPERYSEFVVLGGAEQSICGKFDETELVDTVKKQGYTARARDVLSDR